MKNIALVIEEFKTKNGIKDKDIFPQIGISANAYYTMLKTNSIKATTLEKLANVLGVSVLYFFESEKISDQSKKPKVFLAFELSGDQEDKVIKMVMGQDFINLLRK